MKRIALDKHLMAIAFASVIFLAFLFMQPRLSDNYARAEFDAKVVKVDANKTAQTVYLQCKPENPQCLLDVPLLMVHPTHISGGNASVGDVVRVSALKVEDEWLVSGLRKV